MGVKLRISLLSMTDVGARACGCQLDRGVRVRMDRSTHTEAMYSIPPQYGTSTARSDSRW